MPPRLIASSKCLWPTPRSLNHWLRRASRNPTCIYPSRTKSILTPTNHHRSFRLSRISFIRSRGSSSNRRLVPTRLRVRPSLTRLYRCRAFLPSTMRCASAAMRRRSRRFQCSRRQCHLRNSTCSRSQRTLLLCALQSRRMRSRRSLPWRTSRLRSLTSSRRAHRSNLLHPLPKLQPPTSNLLPPSRRHRRRPRRPIARPLLRMVSATSRARSRPTLSRFKNDLRRILFWHLL